MDVEFNHHQKLQCMSPYGVNGCTEDPGIYWLKRISKHYKDSKKHNKAANMASKNAEQWLFYTVLEGQLLNLHL